MKTSSIFVLLLNSQWISESFYYLRYKNVKQLQHWIKQDSEVFLEDLNNLQTQWDLNVKACELFDKILSKQIWKTHFEKMNQVKEWFDQLNQILWNKLIEAQHQLQSFKKNHFFLFYSIQFIQVILKAFEFIFVYWWKRTYLKWLTEKDLWQARN